MPFPNDEEAMKKNKRISGKAVNGVKGILTAGAGLAKKSPLSKINDIASALGAVRGKARPLVAILMGSPNDWDSMKGAWEVLARMNIPYQVVVASAHRSPEKVAQFARSARGNGLEVIIAGAGMAAHLAGAVAANTTLPVIGVPLKSGALAGVDALYSTVQMPPGIPVATVSIDGARNAGLLALSILSIKRPQIASYLESYRADALKGIEEKAAELAKSVK
jgi:5-(carboxyamino)imidazole ribonucleotide mutase